VNLSRFSDRASEVYYQICSIDWSTHDEGSSPNRSSWRLPPVCSIKPGAGVVSFADIAKAAGYSRTYEFDDLEVFESEIDRILQEEGPVFVDLKVEQGERYPVDYENLHSAERRRAFKEALDALK
jgi:hypothetical protein